jgi:hypothetical protein
MERGHPCPLFLLSVAPAPAGAQNQNYAPANAGATDKGTDKRSGILTRAPYQYFLFSHASGTGMMQMFIDLPFAESMAD